MEQYLADSMGTLISLMLGIHSEKVTEHYLGMYWDYLLCCLRLYLVNQIGIHSEVHWVNNLVLVMLLQWEILKVPLGCDDTLGLALGAADGDVLELVLGAADGNVLCLAVVGGLPGDAECNK